jgi:hypothetical protein
MTAMGRCALVAIVCGMASLESPLSGVAGGLPYRVEDYKPMHDSVTFAPTEPGYCGSQSCEDQFKALGVELRSLHLPIWREKVSGTN